MPSLPHCLISILLYYASSCPLLLGSFIIISTTAKSGTDQEPSDKNIYEKGITAKYQISLKYWCLFDLRELSNVPFLNWPDGVQNISHPLISHLENYSNRLDEFMTRWENFLMKWEYFPIYLIYSVAIRKNPIYNATSSQIRIYP